MTREPEGSLQLPLSEPNGIANAKKPFLQTFRDEKWEALAAAAAEERRVLFEKLQQRPLPKLDSETWGRLTFEPSSDDEEADDEADNAVTAADRGQRGAVVRYGPAASAGLRHGKGIRKTSVPAPASKPTLARKAAGVRKAISARNAGRAIRTAAASAHHGKVGVCELCNRTSPITRHHVYPQAYTRNSGEKFTLVQKHATVGLCWPCHSKCHSLIPHKNMVETFHSISALKSHSGIQAWLASLGEPGHHDQAGTMGAGSSGNAQVASVPVISGPAANAGSYRAATEGGMLHLRALLREIWTENNNDFPRWTGKKGKPWAGLLKKLKERMSEDWVNGHNDDIKKYMETIPAYAAWCGWLFPLDHKQKSQTSVAMVPRIRASLKLIWASSGKKFPRWTDNKGNKWAPLQKNLEELFGRPIQKLEIRETMKSVPEYRDWYAWIWGIGSPPAASSEPQSHGGEGEDVTMVEQQEVNTDSDKVMFVESREANGGGKETTMVESQEEDDEIQEITMAEWQESVTWTAD